MIYDKKPSVYSDRGTIGSVEELDAYGVWVKSEPQDMVAGLAGAVDDDYAGGAMPYEADYDNGFSIPESESSNTGIGDFDDSSMDESAFADDGFGENSFDDDVYADSKPVSDGFTSNSFSDGSGQRTEEVSTHLLMKIADELKSIRSELTTLKKEFADIRAESGATAASAVKEEPRHSDFFEEDEDEKITLTGDELDNILSSANLSTEEEVAFDPLRDEDEAALTELSAQNEADALDEAPFPTSTIDMVGDDEEETLVQAATTDIAGDGEDEAEEIEIDFDNLGIDLTYTEEPDEQASQPENDAAFEENLEPLPVEDASASLEQEEPLFSISEMEEITELSEEAVVHELSEELAAISSFEDADELRSLRIEGAAPLTPPPDESEYLEADPFPLSDSGLDDLSSSNNSLELSIDEAGFDLGMDDFSEETAVLDEKIDEVALEEASLETLSTDEAFLEEAPLEEAILDDAFLEESSSESILLEDVSEETALEEISLDEAPLDDTFEEEASLESFSLDEAPLDDTFAEDTSLESFSLDEVSLEEASSEEPTPETMSIEEESSEMLSLEETTLEDISFEEPSSEEISSEELTFEEPSSEETTLEETTLEELTLEESSSEETTIEESTMETISPEELSLDETPLEEAPMEELSLDETSLEEASLEEASLDETSFETDSVEETSLDLSEAVIDEPDLSAGITETPLEEPSLGDISLEMDDFDLSDDFNVKDDELSVDDNLETESGMNITSDEDDSLNGELTLNGVDVKSIDFALDDFGESFDSEVKDDDSVAVAYNDEKDDGIAQVIPEGFELNAEEAAVSFDDDLEAFSEDELPVASEEMSIPEVTIKADNVSAVDGANIPAGLKTELKNVLSYMDHLLESLPEEKIEEFAKSEYFDAYKKLFKDLGLA